jgi:dihydrodipicolinate synthase/N-acetylneuraminate lyase
MVGFLASAGITSFTYGGNANLFHVTRSELSAALDQVVDVAPADAWVLPSIGPDFGKARDQIPLILERDFPTAMLLPSSAPSTQRGFVEGIRRLAGEFGGPLVIYLKSDELVGVDGLERLMREGFICAVKYAVPRQDTLVDPYLKAMVESCGADRIISGFGERPAIDHWRGFGIKSFTSGLVCVAPHLCISMLAALNAGRFSDAEIIRAQFLPLDELRDEHSPITVLHAAVASLKIAETGPLSPLLSSIDDPPLLRRITTQAERLRRADSTVAGA